MKEKILISNDTAEAEKEISELRYHHGKLAKIHSEFCNLVGNEENKTLTEKEMLSLFVNNYKALLTPDIEAIKELVVNKHFPNGLNGLPVNSSMLKIPDIEIILSVIMNTGSKAKNCLLNGQVVIPGGKGVEITKGAEAAIKKAHMTFVESPEEKSRYDAALTLCSSLNAINALLPKNNFLLTNVQFSGNLETIVDTNGQGEFIPHAYFVKTGRAVEPFPNLKGEAIPEPVQDRISEAYIDSLISMTEE